MIVTTDKHKPQTKTHVDLRVDTPSDSEEPATYSEMESARKKGSIFGKFNARFQDALHTGRGDEGLRDPAREAGDDPSVTADDLAIRRAKSVRGQRMIVPEGVIIEGAMTSGSETEIAGRIEGDVTVEGRLFLLPSALVSGNVRTTTCKVEGLIEGKVECARELEIGETGRLNADAMAGKSMILAGQVFGNVTCGGLLQLLKTSKVTGNIRARYVVIEEGALFNGACSMSNPKQKTKEE